MHGVIPTLPQYAFMVWFSVEKSTGTTSPLLHLYSSSGASLTLASQVSIASLLVLLMIGC